MRNVMLQNQLNGVAWILPGELFSLTWYKYNLTFINLSKPFIRITTVKWATTIEVIETMFR